MSYFKPRNRHLLVNLAEEKKEEQAQVLLPDEYMPEKSEYATVKIKDWSPDCKGVWSRKMLAIVERSMLKEVSLGQDKFHVILENYVLGVAQE